MRCAHAENQFEYRLNKELHMIQQQVPREQKNKQYCRRWISMETIQDLEKHQNLNLLLVHRYVLMKVIKMNI